MLSLSVTLCLALSGISDQRFLCGRQHFRHLSIFNARFVCFKAWVFFVNAPSSSNEPNEPLVSHKYRASCTYRPGAHCPL
jgi:hypothetical protein